MQAASSAGPEGILLVDKAEGWTSHDVVARLRRICGQRRIGHTGTLDPMATGLLVVCLGRATRLVEYMTAHDKAYEGEIVLGVTTDTDDSMGTVTARAVAPRLEAEERRTLEAAFTGRIRQRPPDYSAVKVQGRRAYAIARGGGTPEIAEREVEVRHVRLEQLAAGRLALRVSCGPGTYIRSIARDIGERLGCGAHLGALRRTEVGRFRVEEALAVEEVTRVVEAGRLEDVLLAADEGIVEFDAAILSVGRCEALSLGKALAPDGVDWRAATRARIYSAEGEFAGVGMVEWDGLVRGTKVFFAHQGDSA